MRRQRLDANAFSRGSASMLCDERGASSDSKATMALNS